MEQQTLETAEGSFPFFGIVRELTNLLEPQLRHCDWECARTQEPYEIPQRYH